MLRIVQVLTAAVAGALILLPGPAPVLAHADFERSEPGRNEVLPEPPTRVDVWFTQDLFKQSGRNFVRVTDEQEAQVSDGDGVIDDDDRRHVLTELTPGLPPGRYVVRWMTTSDEDGDSDTGAFCFYVAIEPTAEQAAECAEFDAEQGTTPVGPGPTNAPVPPTPAATPAAVPAPEDENGNGSTAAIVGGVIAAIVTVAAVGSGIVLWRRRGRRLEA